MDIIEHNKSLHQDMLKKTCDYYENILALMPGHVYWLNKDNIYLGCNDIQAKSAGLSSRKEIIGKKTKDLLPIAEALEIDRVNLDIMKSGEPLTTIENANMDQGEGVYFSQKVPLRDERNQVIGLLGISIDITELKKAEANLVLAKEAAEAANQAKTQFIANMSHDIRTPLSGVVGLSKLLEDKLQDNENKQYARWINESGTQLLTLLNEVLELVSNDVMNEYSVNEERFELRQCIESITALEFPMVSLKGLAMRVIIDDKVPRWLIGDRTKLHRVLLNLLGNAIKFTLSGSISIEVDLLRIDVDRAYLSFKVTDTGIGIADELKAKIFDRFFRAEPSYQGGHVGHGIGLHVAQSYVNFLGGRIDLISEPDVGSTFSFDLTFKLAEMDTVNELANDEALPFCARDISSYHVLVVEDNLIASHMITLLVRQVGCQVTSVLSATEALTAVSGFNYDLILTDIGLPDFSGFELVQKIRLKESDANQRAVPIIGLTAHALVFNADNSLYKGMNDVFCKPIDFKTMQQIIHSYILGE